MADRTDPDSIAGYTLGDAPPSPVDLDDLRRLEAAAGLTAADDALLAQAATILGRRAGEMVDAWRAMLAEHPHLAAYGAHPDGTPNPEYAAASHPRFARWIVDLCTRPRDRAWLDYQHEIGRRHTHAAKNATDHADAPAHIPLRYLLAFTGPVIVSTRAFLGDHPDADAMHAAWTKAVLLNVTLWTRPYVADADW